jgi:hypothetical protein
MSLCELSACSSQSGRVSQFPLVRAEKVQDLLLSGLGPVGPQPTSQWQPTADGINVLPALLRDYIHDLETRADPAGEVQELALARMTIAALEARIRELESR